MKPSFSKLFSARISAVFGFLAPCLLRAETVVEVDSSVLPLGVLTEPWTNSGTAGGYFAAFGDSVAVSEVGGKKAVVIPSSGNFLIGPVPPASLVTGQNRTIEVWCLNPAIGPNEVLVSWGARNIGEGKKVALSYGTSNVAVDHDGTGGRLLWGDRGTPAANRWHHLVFTSYNPHPEEPGYAFRQFELYVDGVKSAQVSDFQQPTAATSTTGSALPMLIAAESESDGSHTGIGNGMAIAELRILDERFTAQQVHSRYNAGAAGRYKGLVKSGYDADGDGLNDFWQQRYGVTAATKNEDWDGDGFTNEREETAGTDPRSREDALTATASREGDANKMHIRTKAGHLYHLERSPSLEAWTDTGVIVAGDGSVRSIDIPDEARAFYRVRVEPDTADADSDGLLAFEEQALSTSEASLDSDGDGLTDTDEATVVGTSPSVVDTDSDGQPDGAEAQNGQNPLNPDSNGDGVVDGDELFFEVRAVEQARDKIGRLDYKWDYYRYGGGGANGDPPPMNPPKYYLTQTASWGVLETWNINNPNAVGPDCPASFTEAWPSFGPGTEILAIDPATGQAFTAQQGGTGHNVSATPGYIKNPLSATYAFSGQIVSATQRTGSFGHSRSGGCSFYTGEQTCSLTLSQEYTDEMVKAATAAAMPVWREEDWVRASTVSRDLPGARILMDRGRFPTRFTIKKAQIKCITGPARGGDLPVVQMFRPKLPDGSMAPDSQIQYSGAGNAAANGSGVEIPKADSSDEGEYGFVATPKVIPSSTPLFRSKCASQDAWKWEGQTVIPMSAKFSMSFVPDNMPWLWNTSFGEVRDIQWNPQSKTLTALWDLSALNGVPPTLAVTTIYLGGTKIWQGNLVQNWKRQRIRMEDSPFRRYVGSVPDFYWEATLQAVSQKEAGSAEYNVLATARYGFKVENGTFSIWKDGGQIIFDKFYMDDTDGLGLHVEAHFDGCVEYRLRFVQTVKTNSVPAECPEVIADVPYNDPLCSTMRLENPFERKDSLPYYEPDYQYGFWAKDLP